MTLCSTIPLYWSLAELSLLSDVPPKPPLGLACQDLGALSHNVKCLAS
jgi:hypothetical protein